MNVMGIRCRGIVISIDSTRRLVEPYKDRVKGGCPSESGLAVNA